ncbi:DEAD/DEAH box helicase [Anopheles sinensis]|uniref:DEAD/DEAH box helicase n=1 Tax=Anopheles sinensis TaxID=74873 RepID=A0A084W0B8_ANOSI|nr:DEAD/DEAH box helicase [Anopheles sinensis]
MTNVRLGGLDERTNKFHWRHGAPDCEAFGQDALFVVITSFGYELMEISDE